MYCANVKMLSFVFPGTSVYAFKSLLGIFSQYMPFVFYYAIQCTVQWIIQSITICLYNLQKVN